MNWGAYHEFEQDGVCKVLNDLKPDITVLRYAPLGNFRNEVTWNMISSGPLSPPYPEHNCFHITSLSGFLNGPPRSIPECSMYNPHNVNQNQEFSPVTNMWTIFSEFIIWDALSMPTMSDSFCASYFE